MHLHKFLTGAAIAVTAVSLAGCSAATTTAATTATTSAASAAKKGGLVFIITPAPSNIFFKAEADAAAAEAVKLGYTATEVSHNDDPTTQANLIDTAITRKAVAIILDNAGADVSIGPIQKAEKAGIPVFLVDREISQTGIAKAQIVSNNSQGAAQVATEFAKQMNQTGTYIQLTGKPTDTNAGVRAQGDIGVLSQYPNMKMVATQAANWDQTTAFNVTQTLLQKYPNVNGIIADNDTMALGALAALKAANLNGKVILTGFDGSPDAAAAIKAGDMMADEIQPLVVMSNLAVDEADKYLKTGQTGAPEKQSVDCLLMTKANVDKYTSFGLSN